MNRALFETEGSQRIDRWLWCARFFKTRTLAARFAATDKLRLNGARVEKSSQIIKAGDILTFPLGTRIRVVRIRAFLPRRPSALLARELYEDLSPLTDHVGL